MKRNERNTLNSLKKSVTGDTLNVEIPVSFTDEGMQAIHEMLTIEKGMAAVRINWNNIINEYVIHYIFSASSLDQENERIADIMKRLPVSNYTWNGYKKETTEAKKGEKTMEKATEKNNKPTKYEKDLAIVESILAKGDAITHDDRLQLLSVYQMSWHDSGKIEGTYSLDSSCNGCEFCAKMRAAAEKDNTIICGRCYDYKQETYRTNVKLRHSLNLRIMSSVEFTLDEMAMLPASLIVRINSSGDIENATHARNMVRYAMTHKAAHVGFWGKNRPAIETAFDEMGKPENVVYIASSIHINKRDALPKYADYTFTVYDKEHIAAAIANGACVCNGAKCLDCGYKCYFGTWKKGSDIAEALR